MPDNKSLQEFAKKHGIDWLSLEQTLDENQALKKLVEEQDKLIHEQWAFINSSYRIYCPFWIKRMKIRILEILRPRLGNLNQYAPRPLSKINRPPAIPINKPLRISLVTPSYEQGQFIEQTILSVLEQNYPNLEYVIQDGGSKDETLSILKQYNNKLSDWVSKPDKGQTQAINLGFAKTDGDIMAYLNSDDLLLPGTLAYVSHYFQTHPEVDVVYGNRLLIDEKGLEIGRWILPGHNERVLSWADFVPQETLFWRREIWEKAGGQLDESFRFAMDWDLLIRFKEAGARFAHVPFFMGAFRVHEQQKTSSLINETGFKEMSRIRSGLLGYTPTQRQIRRAISSFILQHIAVDMMYRIKSRSSVFIKKWM
ncbi:glycosyltransferase [Legionella quinlivanii]|uniref:Glycosyltransferase n=1 Tax=Legionella quinlivanii TaxID=45073 RepID=A0A0W0XL89_9GAMM|nr:glycosyltransferase family 2 protein [Legionella quinlivanii]KTD45235.1 glycosyltransferase [Legionella quinlivanii]SEG04288.1 Glycosyl transferase family 2 [Legionella quinlivanii DSM 21216]STY11465.1 glycosyltransferase [Legionella quinlivanii]